MDRNTMTRAHAWALLEEINRLYTFLHPVTLTQTIKDELEADIGRWTILLEDAGYALTFSDEIKRYVFTKTPARVQEAQTPAEGIAMLETVPTLIAVKPGSAMHELEELVEQRKEFEQKYQKVVKQLALMSREQRYLTLERLNAIWGGK